MIRLLFLPLIALVLCSAGCDESADSSASNDANINPKAQLDGTQDYEAKMLEIDARLPQMQPAKSLHYTKADQSSETVTAYLNDAENIVKIEEVYFNATENESGRKEFYLRNGRPFASKMRYIKDLQKGSYKEEVSFYNQQGEVLFTKTRTAEYEEYLDQAEFEQTDVKRHSIETAQLVLNQEGPFATTFQGFTTGGQLEYLIVGGKGTDGYASALAIQYEDTHIAKLRQNPAKYIGTPMQVEFEKLRDESNFEFQVLLRARVLEN